jgi:uncharacterized protein (TIGR03086 family)
MDDLVAKFLTAQSAFDERVHAIREDQWKLDTPDTDWNVADLVAHLIDENQWVAPLLHGLDLESAGKVVEGSRSLPVDGGVGANLAETWHVASLAAADAFKADGALDRTVALSRGTTPVRGYLGEMIFDHIVHSWDLGKAIGYSGPLPDDVVEAVYAMAKDYGDLEATGAFAAPVNVPDDAPIVDKLVGLTGRNPH